MARTGRRLLGGALVATALVVTACSSDPTAGPSRSHPAATVPATTSDAAASTTVTPTPSTSPPSSSPTRTSSAVSRHHRPTTSPTAIPARRPHAARLPLSFATGAATQVVTVVAPSRSSTQGTLQTWRKVSGGWKKVGPAVPAWLGSAGLSWQPSESTSATPIGSFTLTQAFGHDADPGTALPYTHTTPDDWWISEPGPLYNTRQRCASGCPFSRGDPNEHLYYETPYYDYAVVIDYNTRNAPGGVRQGAGSAFFLHVTVGEPTAGCVAIARDQLIRILRWLRPGQAPRILIGVA